MPDDPYLTPAQIRDQVPDLADEDRFTDADLAGLVAEFEGTAERYRGCAFTTREVVGEVHTLDLPGTSLVLRHPLVQEVTALALDGTDLEGDQVLGSASGILTYASGFGVGSVTVSYSHGHETPPAGVLRACRLYVWREAMAEDNPNTGNSYVTSNPQLGIVERSSTADFAAGRPTGWLDVDRLLNGLPDHRTPGIA